MSLRAQNMKFDGLGPITKGVDSARAPYLLDREQLVWLINCTTRDNTISTRPGWNKRTLSFVNQSGTTDTTVQANFQTNGRFQGASAYEADSGLPYILASIGGRIFLINPSNMAVQDLTTQAGEVNSSSSDQTWFAQAENFLVIQNGEDDAFVFDGGTLKRSYGQAKVGADNAGVPIGRQMAYNNGRLWVAISPYSFVAGDLAYSVTGTRSDVLSFTENTFLNGGGAFMVPFGGGPIRAMQSVAVQDNSTGQGPLQIFTTRGCFSVNAPFNRDDWQNVTSPIETISMLAAGAVSQNATVNVNGDIWFRSPDGVRSFVIARRDHGTWVNTPLSNEMRRAFSFDTPALLPYASATLFDNRMLITTQPRIVAATGTSTPRGIAHKGLAVLDFDPVSSMFARSNPNWDGVWTGLDILQILTIGSDNPRCFAFVLNASKQIELWELSKNDTNDQTTSRIQGVIETPAYGFDTIGFNLRRLMTGDLWLTDIASNLDLTIKYRPDTDANWTAWTSAAICTSTTDCALAACATPTVLATQYRARVQLPEPDQSAVDLVTNKPPFYGYRFAMRVEFTGSFSLQQARISANDIPEDVTGSCPPEACTPSTVPLACVNDYTYTITP